MRAPLRNTLTLPSIQRGLSIYLMAHTEASRGFSAVLIHNISSATIAFICASDLDECHFVDAYGGNWELWMRGGYVCLAEANAAKAAKFLGIPFASHREAA
ncbi:hypothetical protein [Herbaspirillum rubrisubalbicans]|uniref:Uncharacterized protein n=1 Tax=Herbaspirillum rubrisubalbicans TaxID=80842 RepID=A0ABX9BZ92_9BURK|nr:hypothetical protein [Herbaspirillum rubrisubalbicans]RAM63120.1 hypothetical protein RB24_17490 [Herbaspirillum rubrisubalbicans]